MPYGQRPEQLMHECCLKCIRITVRTVDSGKRQRILTEGIRWLCLARVNAIWTPSRAANARMLPEMYKNYCPYCRQWETPEDLERRNPLAMSSSSECHMDTVPSS